MQIDPAQLGTLQLEEDTWVPYINLHDEEFVPTRLNVSGREYGFESSIIVFGHGAVLPGKIKELRAAGKKPIIGERGDRYYVFVTPP